MRNPPFDLLGDPVPENHGEKGRPAHITTAENVRKVRCLLMSGMTVEDVAKQLGISAPTLRQHYFSSGKINHKTARKRAIAEMRARNLLRLDAEADKGKVSAINALNAETEKLERELIEADLGAAPKPKEQTPGVKKQREMLGFEADDELDAELNREADGRMH